jgi:serine/threonine protein kinase
MITCLSRVCLFDSLISLYVQPLSNYKTGEVLGSGAFSTVFRAKDLSGNTDVALKVSRKKDLSPEDVVGIRQEAEIMQSFTHPNIVRFYTIFEDKDNFYTVLEIIQGGQLFDRIATKKKYTENEARDLVKILLNAIKYCHDHGVAHRSFNSC